MIVDPLRREWILIRNNFLIKIESYDIINGSANFCARYTVVPTHNPKLVKQWCGKDPIHDV